MSVSSPKYLNASSIVEWGYPDNFKSVYFFLRKRFCAHKNTSHLEVYPRVKNCCLCCVLFAGFCFVSWFLLVTCFCAREIFSSFYNTIHKGPECLEVSIDGKLKIPENIFVVSWKFWPLWDYYYYSCMASNNVIFTFTT